MKFKLVLIGFCLVFSGFKGISQEVFPKFWEGNYKGELQIYGVDSVQMRVAMQLAIVKKTDSLYQWKMTYNYRGKEDVRAYELIVKNHSKGHYIIDEKNSILIDGFYKSGIFTSFFKVMNSFIVSTYTKKGDAIIFEIISVNGKSNTKSGNQKIENEEIPEVVSYLVNGRQKAILKKEDLPSN
ncbi:hypothetical protein ACFQZW_10670 [Lutibacter aestuarii]|uniref:DUF4468 domain-containing protein n=1 Tax=Lutibacter aestuarii TaxID=861111 RepID=A0ABW2Z8N2_9FLAO